MDSQIFVYAPSTRGKTARLCLFGLLACLGLTSLAITGCGQFGAGLSNVKLVLSHLPPELTQNTTSSTQNLANEPALHAALSRASAPTKIKSLALTISGPGMTTQNYYYYKVPNSIAVEVPAGNARHFTLEIFFEPALLTTAAISYRGETEVDLKAGGTKELNLKMVTGDTKIVIPDSTYYEGRLVQIDNMQGDGWIEKKNEDFITFPLPVPLPTSAPTWHFQPSEVDFDSSGRIYLVMADYGTSMPLMFRLYNINDLTPENICVDPNKGNLVAGLTPYISTFAINRQTDYVYYADGSNNLGVWDLTTATVRRTSFAINAPISNIKRIAVSKQGMVYMAGIGSGNDALPTLVKFDPQLDLTTPTGGVTLKSWTDPHLKVSATLNRKMMGDILVKDNYLLVANPYGDSGWKILKFDLDLNLLATYGLSGDLAVCDTRSGYVYAPYLFLATGNREIYLADDECPYSEKTNPTGGPTRFENERVIAFTDPRNWNGWSAFRATSIGKNPFTFDLC